MKTILILLLTAASCFGGSASWYSTPGIMANGHRLDATKLTCASWFYPMGTVLEVRCPERGSIGKWRSVRVTVTDRGPARRYVRQGRIIDLTPAAFQKLTDLDEGVIEVEVRPCK